MSWKEKVDYGKFVLFCDIYRSKIEIEKEFGLTKSESTHAMKYFSKFADDFDIVKDVGSTSRAWWVKSTKNALKYWMDRES